MAEAVEPGVFDVGDQHRKCVPRGILQARETFIGREGGAATLQDEEEGSHQEQAERQRDHELRQIEAAARAMGGARSARHRRLRQHLQRDTVGAGVIARIGPAQRDDVTGRCGGAGGGREFHSCAGVGMREEGVRRGFEVGEVRGRELRDVAAAGSPHARCRSGRRRTARVVVDAAARIRADAIGHVAHQAQRGNPAQRAGMAAQAVEQQGGRA